MERRKKQKREGMNDLVATIQNKNKLSGLIDRLEGQYGAMDEIDDAEFDRIQ